MATFDLELVSPEKLILSRPVEMATIPAAEGEMGVPPRPRADDRRPARRRHRRCARTAR
jgi:hypothetical protein